MEAQNLILDHLLYLTTDSPNCSQFLSFSPLLENECLCPSQIPLLKPNPQSYGIWRWSLCEVTGSWWWHPHEWDWWPCRTDPGESASLYLLPREDSEKTAICEMGSRSSQDTESVRVLILDSQSAALWEMHFCGLQTTLSGEFYYSSLCWLTPFVNLEPLLFLPKETELCIY